MAEPFFLIDHESIHSLFKKILPLLGFNIPVIVLHKVDFPAPLLPRTASISPLFKWKETSLRVFLIPL